jgi:hypothetical protein
MATTLGYDEMLRKIVEDDQRKVDLLADTRKMSASVEDGKVLVDIDRPDGSAQTFALNDYCLGQVSNDLSIPKGYFDRMRSDAPDLLVTNVNHWLAHEPNRRILRGYKPQEGEAYGVGRAFVSSGYKRLDYIEIARRIFPVFKDVPGLTFHQAQITDTKLYLRAVLPGLQYDVNPEFRPVGHVPGEYVKATGGLAVGDVLQAGIEIRNSEVGAGQLEINPFVFRLICLNGMVVREYGVQRRHVGKRISDEEFYADDTLAADDNAFWLKARDDAAAVLGEVRFEEIARSLGEKIHGDKIVAPVAATAELAQRFSLTEAEKDAVLRELVTAGDLSQWGALNAVTAAAKGVESFDRQVELEQIGWDIAQLAPKEWANVAVAA